MTASNLISILDLVFRGGLWHSKFKLRFKWQVDNPEDCGGRSLLEGNSWFKISKAGEIQFLRKCWEQICDHKFKHKKLCFPPTYIEGTVIFSVDDIGV